MAKVQVAGSPTPDSIVRISGIGAYGRGSYAQIQENVYMEDDYLPDNVRPEKHAYRDEDISRRHRMWGFNCPAADLDFVMVEYNIGKPVALVEYKYYLHKITDFNHPTYRAIRCLADEYKSGPLPFIVSLYSRDDWSFRVYCVNEAAEKHFCSGEHLSELEYVQRLYRMRRQALAKHLENQLNTTIKEKSNGAIVSPIYP
jgi:hypothetical protein